MDESTLLQPGTVIEFDYSEDNGAGPYVVVRQFDLKDFADYGWPTQGEIDRLRDIIVENVRERLKAHANAPADSRYKQSELYQRDLLVDQTDGKKGIDLTFAFSWSLYRVINELTDRGIIRELEMTTFYELDENSRPTWASHAKRKVRED